MEQVGSGFKSALFLTILTFYESEIGSVSGASFFEYGIFPINIKQAIKY